MELEALQQIHAEVRALGAQIVVITPELERYTRALHKKLTLTYDILTDLLFEDRRAISACLHITGLLARALQIIRKHFGQVPR